MQLQKEIKSFKFDLKATAEENNNFIFEGYASTFGNVDYGKDLIMQGAFAKSLQNNPNVPILWQHSMHEPIGVSTILNENDKGLYVKAILPKDDIQVSGKVMPQMRVGSIKEMSIGYFTKDSEMQKGIRILKEIDLFEISLVTKAMNPKAQIENYKAFLEQVEDLRGIEKTLKEAGFSSVEARTLISKVKEFSSQRDVDEQKAMRDAEQKAKLLAEISNLTNFIKSIKH